MTLDLDDLAVPDQLRPFAEIHSNADDPLARMAEMLQYAKLTAGLEPSALAAFALRLREADPTNRTVWTLTQDTLGAGVPSWHWLMVNDLPRNESYENAINQAVQPGMTVLDIGAGTGLLSMMSARAGAEHVYAVEQNPLMAEIARRCIAANGFSDRITILEMNSDAIEIGIQIPVRCDLLTHEILSTAVLQEGVIPCVARARKNLLTPEAPLLPERIWAECVLSERVGTRSRSVGKVSGFDLSPLNLLSPASISDAPEPKKVLSARFRLPEFNLRSVSEDHRGRQGIEVRVTNAGHAAGITQWLGYGFSNGSDFVSDNKQSNWGSYFHSFGDGTPVNAGDHVTISAEILPKNLSFSME
ncbi:MAG: 50S ribosomal protein L11 methyltransferase [Pseudomonadota bacterium]